MAGFPPEVLAEICQHLKNDKDTLKALRLVNQFLGVEAAKYLYKTLLVYATPSSWEKLHSVAFCQHLTRYTEELEVATLEYLPAYADFEAWASATSMARLAAQGSSSSLAGAAAVISDAGRYRSYCRWRHDELELLNRITETENGGGLLYWEQSVDGVTLPNLHTVKSLGAHELWPWTPQGPTNKRERETAVLETMEPNTRTCKRMSAHLCMALQLFHVSGGLGVNIVSLELHRYREILAEQTFHVPALQTLRRLTLSFPSGPETKIESVLWGPWKLAPWLRNARGLESLTIVTQDLRNIRHNSYRNVIRLFNDAVWPKLDTIYFTETFMTSKYLLPFLKKHVRKLKTLWIMEPIVKEDDWQRIADKIRTMFSTTTCDLFLDDPHSDAEDEPFLDDNDENNFFTPECHPDFGDLHWDERHEYRDLLEEGEGEGGGDEEEEEGEEEEGEEEEGEEEEGEEEEGEGEGEEEE